VRSWRPFVSPVEKRFGRHSLRFEPPNLYVMTLVGDVTGVEMASIFAEPLRPEHDPSRCLLLLVDVRRIGAVHPTARKASHVATTPSVTNYIAYVGAGLSLRVMSNMFLRGIQLKKWIEHAFFPDEQSARTWLDERNRSHA